MAIVLTGCAPIGAVSAQTQAAASLESRGASLQPGQSVWRDDAAGAGPVAILISLPMQLAYVYRDGQLVGVSTVSTGKRGKATPAGAFTILQKKVFHRSNLYSNAPMPYMQRLTWSGIALHAGDLPGYPASHGCIRFPAAFAKRLYDATALGGEVRIIDAPLPGIRQLPQPEPKPRELPPVIVADAGSIARQDDAARVGEASAAPRIDLGKDAVRFAAYDAVFARGYGAKGAVD